MYPVSWDHRLRAGAVKASYQFESAAGSEISRGKHYSFFFFFFLKINMPQVDKY